METQAMHNENNPPVTADHALGIIRGTVSEVSLRPTLQLALYDALFDSPVCCYLNEDQQEVARQAWGRRVEVTGMIHRDPETGRPIEVRGIRSIEIVDDAVPRSYEQAKGIGIWQQGDEPAEITIRRLRNAS